MRANDLVGAWRLVSFYADGPRGRRFPYGEDARGLIVYGPDGWMSAVLSRADRGPFGSETMERAGGAPEADKARAFDGYTSYAGRYTIEGDRVRHAVEVALVPPLVGQTLERRARFDVDELVLTYEVQGRKHAYEYTLRWRRP